MSPTPAVSAKARTGAEMIAHHRFRLDADNNTAEIDSSGLAEEIDNALAALSATEGEAEPVAWVQPGYLEMLQKYGSCSMRAEPVEPLDYIMPLYASPPSAPAGVEVKPLEWDEGRASLPERHATAHSVVGGYKLITFETVGRAPKLAHYWRGPEGRDVRVDSFDEAKAAAQADYEQRIRSSLQPDTQAGALVDAPAIPKLDNGVEPFADTQAHGGGVEAVARIIAKWVDDERFADAPAFRMAAREIISALAASPAAPAPAAGVDQVVERLSERDEKIMRDWLLATRSHRGGSRLGKLLALRIADELEADGVTEADIDRLFPAPDAKGER